MPQRVTRFGLEDPVGQQRVPVPRPVQRERFLRGPIPMVWLERAASLPGRALHVGIMLWYVAGLKKSGRFRFSLAACARLGFDRTTASRGLRALEMAGLVVVERRPGCKPIVTILSGHSE
jgi:hypothetical protein